MYMRSMLLLHLFSSSAPCALDGGKQWQVLVLYCVMCEEGDRRDGDSDSGVASCGVVVW